MDLKEIWQKHESQTPDMKMIIRRAEKYKSKNRLNLILFNMIAVFTVIWILFVWYYYQPAYLTTKIGIILMSVAIAWFVSVYNQLIPLIFKVSLEMDCRQYLNQLQKIEEKKQFIQSGAIGIYFILLGLALSLYSVEYVLKMPTLTRTIYCFAMASWIAFSWFYLRPEIIRKQNTKMKELIDEFKKIEGQINDPDT